MAEAKFTYDGQEIIIQCNKNQKMKDICNSLSTKINVGINSLIFLFGGDILNLEKTFEELTKDNQISIVVDKYEDVCPKCGKILNNDIINEIISSNNKMSYSLIGLKRQIELIISDINKNADINYINSQLQNINVVINNINEDIKKMNNKLNNIELNDSNIIKPNKDNNDKEEQILESKITCVYNKQKDVIDLLHNYYYNTDDWEDGEKKPYLQAKNDINEKNVDIYINDKKIKFNHKYKSNEKGNIKVKFIFNKLLTSTSYMFENCTSLESIDLSSFNTTSVKNMSHMFSDCSSLESIDLSSFNTTNVKNMSSMFDGCSSLESITLSSFNTTNVKNMSYMFSECSSLESIDLSSFNTTNVKNMKGMLSYCSSLKKKNIKIKNYGKKILDEICWIEI